VSLETQAVAVGIVILLAISHEVHRMKQQTAHREALGRFNQGIPANPLPKKFELKLVAEMQATPAEFADALLEETQRPSWELRLKQIKKKSAFAMELEYLGTSAPHQVSYDLEILPATPSTQLTSLIVHEFTIKNKGMVQQASIYLLEEI